MKYNYRKNVGTLEQLEQDNFIQASKIFSTRSRMNDYTARLYLSEYRRQRCLIWEYDGNQTDVHNISLIFRITEQSLLNFTSINDFESIEEFEFLLIDRYCGILKITLNNIQYYFCTGNGKDKMEQFVMYFDSIPYDEHENVVFISKVLPHQSELLISVHEGSSWKSERELLRFSTIIEDGIRGEIINETK